MVKGRRPQGPTQSWSSATPKTPVQTTNPPTLLTAAQESHGIRQWSFSAFEWTVGNVRDLQKFVEEQPMVSSIHSEESGSSNATGVPRLLQETPLVGDGKFKLEISRMMGPDDSASAEITSDSATSTSETIPIVLSQEGNKKLPTTLSLCLTSLQLDFYPDCELGTTIMVGIKSSPDITGQRGARTEWVWEIWEDFVFRKGSEFWECTLPSLAALLENPRISANDSFTISIQVHTPSGPHFPQQPSAYYVPKDLLDGLEASLDNSNTGDVQFICLERYTPPDNDEARESNVELRRQSPSNSPSMTARKRIIYAHSDILTRRSEYFATLIASSFRESSSGNSGMDRERGRTIHTIVVEEADFVTIYWLLKYLYCDWLLFREEDDPRAAVDGIGAGWNAQWLAQGGEWDWKTLSPETGQFEGSADREDDATGNSVASESMSTGSGESRSGNATVMAPSTPHNRTPSRSANTVMRPSAAVPSGSTSIPRRPTKLPTSGLSITPSARSASSSSRSSPAQALYYPGSPSQSRFHSTRQPDPHPHPTPAPVAASALSIYQIAHRYQIHRLQQLALEHMMTTISTRSAFPLLLATCFWEELHTLVQDYIVETWQAVSRSEDFEHCCQEVAAGEWGPEGGKTLASLFRRLHSPASMRYGSS
ncbi:hypothetical protein FRC14_007283 [Serendipita sp. 396]|nr:hypothetical protein FRC14_007283 [Serendipita sp. 396]